jgi:small GTP-binding protein
MAYKSGFISVIGKPNVGKSTLLNALTGEKIAIMSNKPQTTRNTIRAVITSDECQLVLIDTPGIHKPKTKLGEFMVNVASETIKDVDLIFFLAEATSQPESIDVSIIEQLKQVNTPIFLVLNKVDIVDKERLLTIITKYSELMDFKAVIPVSALKKDGLESDHIRQAVIHYSDSKKERSSSLTEEAEAFISRLGIPMKPANIEAREDRLYLVPETLPDLKGLRIMRQGLFLGEMKKNRFEPSQALACSLKMEEYDKIINLSTDNPDIIKYLKCETIPVIEEHPDGWQLVCVDGYPLGWGKLSGGTLKNKYLPGWRWM